LPCALVDEKASIYVQFRVYRNIINLLCCLDHPPMAAIVHPPTVSGIINIDWAEDPLNFYEGIPRIIAFIQERLKA
jgi:hypothetical protein